MQLLDVYKQFLTGKFEDGSSSQVINRRLNVYIGMCELYTYNLLCHARHPKVTGSITGHMLTTPTRGCSLERRLHLSAL